jgi:hypothetical protein
LQQVNQLGYTVVNADRPAGLIQAEKDVAGAGMELLTGENYWVLLTVSVYENQSTKDTQMKVTVARAKESISGIAQGQRTSGGMSTKQQDRDDAMMVVNECGGEVTPDGQTVQSDAERDEVSLDTRATATAKEPEPAAPKAQVTVETNRWELESPERQEPDLIRGAWQPTYRRETEVHEQAPPPLEHWAGSVEGGNASDVPKVTVRLYDAREIGSDMGAVIYWYDQRQCVYSLYLREMDDQDFTVSQIPESPECGSQGEILFRPEGEALLAVWLRPDGSTWFSTRLTND